VGRADEAIDALKTLLVPTAPRPSVIALADIALARVIQDEPEQACQDLRHALDLTLDTGYTMGGKRIRGARDRFPG
jgi:hypothetical protein